ncbi:MEDS domain-containing protein [Paraburkholderia sp. DHOC27]|uniref:MEDS domain-containing protein n=1 Tax=Paraburkholderia sp. DHOC27 TaxID=2303330 RepID=UPI000E3B6014|nr:MEDS domain-containing protein [Paraburkholderia sp. DHOC27]RFU49684.1 GHKL domain-containing protein [Paraburkholderia sp. DHOC27]
MHNHSEQSHAPSGVAALPSLAWGSHVGQLYGSAGDLRDLLVPYFKAGLENNERCLWVTDAPFGMDDARSALRTVVPDLDARERQGQIEIRDTRAFYDRDRPLDPEALVAGLVQLERDALASGYRGLRTNGNCAWVERANWDSFLTYEASVQEAVRGRRLICMCSYQHDIIEAGQVKEVLDRHQFVLRSPHERSPAQALEQAATTVIEPITPDGQAHVDAVQAMAVLGHDLRNPVAAISAGAAFLQRVSLDDRARAVSAAIGKSADHLTALIDDLSDMTRGRFGNGIVLRLSRHGLVPALRHAVDELRLVHPGRVIEDSLSIERPVEADPVYMARLLSNLLKNALVYGSQIDPVKVMVSTEGGEFVLSVSNRGRQISPESRQRLFAPFTRGAVAADQQGLGLGLYIVAEIARAHGGTIKVSSTQDETRFSFRMPIL